MSSLLVAKRRTINQEFNLIVQTVGCLQKFCVHKNFYFFGNFFCNIFISIKQFTC
jgi:hypothetical protein